MQPESKKYLYDISQAINEIELFIKGVNIKTFNNNQILQSALERKYEIIGEALNRIKRINEEILSRITDAHKIIGLRNILAHGYDMVDIKILWDATKNNLPKLKQEIKKLIEE